MQAVFEREDMARGVGIGLDAGEAVPVGKGYRGGALNMAARLCSIADPGAVLASEAVVHLARKVDGIRYLQGRVERLKGIEQPVRVVEVVSAERAVARAWSLRRRLRAQRRPLLAGAVAVVAAAAVAALVLSNNGRSEKDALNAAVGGGLRVERGVCGRRADRR